MRVKNKLLLSIMRNIVAALIISSLIAITLTGCGEKTLGDELPNGSESAAGAAYSSDNSESEAAEPPSDTEEITSEDAASETMPEVEAEEDSLPPADSNIGGLLDDAPPEEEDNLPGGSLLPLGSVPPENEYLRSYFDEMEQLLGGWRDEGKFGINKLGFDLTLPRIDIVIATDSDAEALKNELISMGDYSEEIPYYNEDVIRITIGEHFPDDTR